jgi:hypothetical protein
MQVLGIGLLEVLTIFFVLIALLTTGQLDRLINVVIDAVRDRRF